VRRIAQVDVMKGIAALGVVFLHTVSRDTLIDTWSVIHLWQSVPVFMVLMGLAACLSYQRGLGAAAPSARQGVARRLGRLLGPFLVAWFASLMLALQRHTELQIGYQTFLSMLPGPGRGSYFVAIAIVYVLIAPALCRAMLRWPLATVLSGVFLNVTFELIAPHVSLLADQWNYAVNPLRYLTLFVLGIWLATQVKADGTGLSRSAWLAGVPYGLVGATYLIVWNLGLYDPGFLVSGWTIQNPASFGWAFLLCVAGLSWLPANPASVFLRSLAELGKASYHIFMTQMIVVVVAPSESWTRLAFNLIACSLIGYGWYLVEGRVRARVGRASLSTGSR